jgi:hypothetical protein
VKQETLYERIEKELKDIKQAIHSSRAVPIAPSSAEIAELGDEPCQLRRLVDTTEAQICRFQEEKENAIEYVLEQLQVM